MGQPASASHIVAYVWAPYFETAVARRADPKLGAKPLALLDEQGRVLAVDAAAANTGVQPGMHRHQAAACCPEAALLPAGRFPLWEAQERFLAQIRGYSDRWQPLGLGQACLQAPFALPAQPTAGIGPEVPTWCQAVAAAVRALGWQPALGATDGKFGAIVAGQACGR